MEKRRKRQVLDDTGSRSHNSACRRLNCIGPLPVDLRQQQLSVALWATEQTSLGTALLVPHGDGPRKFGLNKAFFNLTWLANHGKRASLPRWEVGGGDERKKTVSLKVACWNIHTMQDSKDRP